MSLKHCEGTASGKEPTECVKLQSYVGKFLNETGISLGTEDEDSFEMRLLHFRRTFVEKLFAIHSKVEKFKQTGIGIGGYARHYYDLFCLAGRQEVLAMLRSNEYEAIKVDYDRVSRKHFEADYVAPTDMNFAKSEALFPKGNIEMALAAEFEKQCRILCFGEFPTWGQVQERLISLQYLL
ncbi:MAG: nucleotidyl transferase AbiEii/AbiGii toxin family protein [Chlamydiales bacterium]